MDTFGSCAHVDFDLVVAIILASHPRNDIACNQPVKAVLASQCKCCTLGVSNAAEEGKDAFLAVLVLALQVVVKSWIDRHVVSTVRG